MFTFNSCRIIKSHTFNDVCKAFADNRRLISEGLRHPLKSEKVDNRTHQKVRLYSAKHRTMSGNIFKFTDYDCIGFDLDNTIARYKVGAMIEMEYDILAKYLVEQKGYSKKHLLQPLDHNFIIKGLIVDDENGNLLRISDNGTIIQAAHGTRLLSESEIYQYYPNLRWNATDLFTEDPLQTWNGPYAEKMRTLLDYYDIITSLVFARAVDAIDEDNSEKKLYNIWPDLLEALQNMFNREHFQNEKGKYFAEIKSHPEKYYYKCSQNLLNWILGLRKKGKQTFLITGSYIDFATHTATNTIGLNWRDYFDIVISYAKKPGFFTMRRDFIAVDGFKEVGPIKVEDLKLGGIYTHGNWTDLKEFLHKHSKIENPKYLYIGDNLIQDIYTPCVYANCDTVTVCEELEAEGKYGLERWHPDEQFLCSTIWGSYFKCKKTNRITNWYHLMKTYSKYFIPSLEYVATFPIDYEFKTDEPMKINSKNV